MHADPERIVNTDNMETVMEKFSTSNAWNLAVVDEDGKYLGMVSKSKIFSAYREQLIEVSEA
jgi:CIC family chloride channel protein